MTRSKTRLTALSLLALLAISPLSATAQDKTPSEKRAAEAAKYWPGQNIETLKDGYWTKAVVVGIRGESVKIKFDDWRNKGTFTVSPDDIRVPPVFNVGKTIRWKKDGKILYGDVIKDDSQYVTVKIGTRDEWLSKFTTTFLTPTVVTRPPGIEDNPEELEVIDAPYRPGEPIRFMNRWGSGISQGYVLAHSGDDKIYVRNDYSTERMPRWWGEESISRKEALHGPAPLPSVGKDSDIKAINHQSIKALKFPSGALSSATTYTPPTIASPSVTDASPIPLTDASATEILRPTLLVSLTEKPEIMIAYQVLGQPEPVLQRVDPASRKAGPLLRLSKPGEVVAFSNDGARAATTFGGVITLWNLTDPKPSVIVQFDPYGAERYFNPLLDTLRFTADNRLLLIGGQQSILFLEFEPQAIRSLMAYEAPARFIYSVNPTGSAIAITSRTSREITFINTATGQVFARLNAPFDLKRITFSPDGARLSAVENASLLVWDIGEQRMLFQGALQEGVSGVPLSLDPTFVLINQLLLSTKAGIALMELPVQEPTAIAPSAMAWVVRNQPDGAKALHCASLTGERLKSLASKNLDEKPYLFSPGDRVNLQTTYKYVNNEFKPPADFEEKCRAHFEKNLLENGFILDPKGPIKLAVYSYSGHIDPTIPIVPEKLAARWRNPFNPNHLQAEAVVPPPPPPAYGPAPAGIERITHVFSFSRADQITPFWTSAQTIENGWNVVLKPNQTRQQAFQEDVQRSYQHYLTASLPRLLPKPLTEVPPEIFDPFAKK